ncbi:hypothetical protein T484DRAFT_1853314, partial [Baffinella frigidus]
DGKKYVTLKYPDLLPAMQKCARESTREALDRLRGSQCQEANAPLLEDALEVRQELAALLGFESHAAYVLQVRMAKETSTVEDMWVKLLARLKEPASKEIARLVQLKDEEKKVNASNMPVAVE